MATATKTWAQRHELVVLAIEEILLTGQSVSYNGRSVSMANLQELRDLEADYEKRARAEAGKPVRSRVSYITPTGL